MLCRLRRVKLIITTSAFAVALSCLNGSAVQGATYGHENYGDCPYSEGCVPPVVITNNNGVAPVPGDYVEIDTDGDGNKEKAVNANSNQADGYEVYEDNDESSKVIVRFDGDGDGKFDFLIDTDDDGLPERYFDPDRLLVSTIQMVQCDADEESEWAFDNGDKVIIYDPGSGELLEQCTSGAGAVPTRRDDGQAITGKNQNRITGTLLLNSSTYQSLKVLLKKMPVPLIRGLPYLLIFLLLIMAMRLVIQAKQELKRIVAAKRNFELEKKLYLEKQNFVMLGSHYLRTPITIIRGNIELLQSKGKLNEESAKIFASLDESLVSQVSSIISGMENDQRLAKLEPPKEFAYTKNVLSFFSLAPLILLILLLVISNFLFIDFRITNPGVIDLATQGLLLLLVTQLFLSKLRERHINKANYESIRRVLRESQELDEARNKFITATVANLEDLLTRVKERLSAIQIKEDSVLTEGAYAAAEELSSMITKFKLVSSLQCGKVQGLRTKFELPDVVDTILGSFAGPAASKSVEFIKKLKVRTLYQNKSLLEIMLASIIDNAVKFSNQYGRILVSSSVNNKNLRIIVEDEGSGIDNDKTGMLFKPFSRTNSVQRFNQGGLGFSLYLDKIIAGYLGGELEVNSSPDHGTTVSIVLPG